MIDGYLDGDSVEEFDPVTERGNGFVFQAYNDSEMLAAVDRAVVTFHNRNQWATLMKNAMGADYSWGRSARGYLSLYERLMGI